MNPKTTGSLLVAAVGLFAFILFVELPARQASVVSIDTRVLPDFDRAAATAVTIRPAGQNELRAELTPQGWRLIRPLNYPAHAERIDALLQLVEQLRWRGEISPAELKDRPEAQEEFGLAAPQVSLIIEQDDRRIHLLVGSYTVFGDEVFLQEVGARSIFVADAEWLKYVPRQANHWRDTAVLRVENLDMDGLRVRAGEHRFELELDPVSRSWRMTKPLETRADHTRISQLLAGLHELQIKEFVSDDPEPGLDLYGLRTPELELLFTKGTNQLKSLQIGRSPAENPAMVYARRSDDPAIILLPREPLDPWRVSHSQFRERRLARVPFEGVERIEITHHGKPFTLRLRDDGLWIVEPEQSLADTGLVQAYLNILAAIQVQFERSVVTDFSVYGLDDPQMRLALYGANSPSAKPVLLATIDFAAGEDKVFVRHNNEASVTAITPSEFRRLPHSAWQVLRQRRIWSFESTDVVGVLVQHEGRERRLVRNERFEWTFAPGHQGIINTFALEETLHRLGELQAVFWHARGEESSGHFGFSDADHRVILEVKRASGPEVLTIEFGRPSEFGHPYAAASIDGERLVFEFPWTLYHELVREHLTIPGTTLSARD